METNPDTINTLAFEWVARQESRTLTPEEQRELEDWLATDERHAGALLRAQAHWDYTGRLASMSGGKLPDVSRVPQRSRASSPSWRTRHSGLRRLTAAAALILLMALAATFYLDPDLLTGETYTSEIGEVRNIELADGSTVTLNTNSRIAVRYSADKRQVLIKRGEAEFRVARDTQRPFSVHANDTTVTALGTSFTVRIDENRTDVVVTEGTVEILVPKPSALSAELPNVPFRLGANHRATVSGRSLPDVETLAPSTIERSLAWRDGKAAFDGEPLGLAAAEINRHSRVHIYVDDPALAARPVVGIFRANDADAFATGAATTFGARVERRNGEIHLKAANSP